MGRTKGLVVELIKRVDLLENRVVALEKANSLQSPIGPLRSESLDVPSMDGIAEEISDPTSAISRALSRYTHVTRKRL